MRIGVDIDGVLANFNAAYAGLLTGLGATGLPDYEDEAEQPEVWHWPTEQFGVDSEIEDKAWDYIRRSGEFWGHLDPYPITTTAIARIEQLRRKGHEFYFITSRPGQLAKYQTERWLWSMGAEAPTVIVVERAEKKADIFKALGLQFMIEDHPETTKAMAEALVNGTAQTIPILVRRAYNKPVQEAQGVYAVDDVLQGLDALVSPDKDELEGRPKGWIKVAA